MNSNPTRSQYFAEGLVFARYLMCQPDLTKDKVFDCIAAESERGVTGLNLLQQGREMAVTYLQSAACYVLHRRFGTSYSELGRMFHQKDHTSVRLRCIEFEEAMKEYTPGIDRICARIYPEFTGQEIIEKQNLVSHPPRVKVRKNGIGDIVDALAIRELVLEMPSLEAEGVGKIIAEKAGIEEDHFLQSQELYPSALRSVWYNILCRRQELSHSEIGKRLLKDRTIVSEGCREIEGYAEQYKAEVQRNLRIRKAGIEALVEEVFTQADYYFDKIRTAVEGSGRRNYHLVRALLVARVVEANDNYILDNLLQQLGRESRTNPALILYGEDRARYSPLRDAFCYLALTRLKVSPSRVADKLGPGFRLGGKSTSQDLYKCVYRISDAFALFQELLAKAMEMEPRRPAQRSPHRFKSQKYRAKLKPVPLGRSIPHVINPRRAPIHPLLADGLFPQTGRQHCASRS